MLERKDIPLTWTPLAERPAGAPMWYGAYDDPSPGRRLRVFAYVAPRMGVTPMAQLMDEQEKNNRAYYAHLPLYEGGTFKEDGTLEEHNAYEDPTLHPALQDLANEINEDVHEACAAFDNPHLHYPGSFDPAIPPVPSSHVATVIAALQRELNRELRDVNGQFKDPRLPAVTLADLPFRIQRALVERRRRRFYQYGITIEKWQTKSWSLWDIPLDPDWVPRRDRRIFGL